ncbi:MAG: hypothetical protein ACLQNE_05355 [Thermoguttaceae bacterium]
MTKCSFILPRPSSLCKRATDHVRIRSLPDLFFRLNALYNWKRFDPTGPIALGNIDTLQNFVHLYDEHWFILVHVEIEAVAAEILAGIHHAAEAMRTNGKR